MTDNLEDRCDLISLAFGSHDNSVKDALEHLLLVTKLVHIDDLNRIKSLKKNLKTNVDKNLIDKSIQYTLKSKNIDSLAALENFVEVSQFNMMLENENEKY